MSNDAPQLCGQSTQSRATNQVGHSLYYHSKDMACSRILPRYMRLIYIQHPAITNYYHTRITTNHTKHIKVQSIQSTQQHTPTHTQCTTHNTTHGSIRSLAVQYILFQYYSNGSPLSPEAQQSRQTPPPPSPRRHVSPINRPKDVVVNCPLFVGAANVRFVRCSVQPA